MRISAKKRILRAQRRSLHQQDCLAAREANSRLPDLHDYCRPFASDDLTVDAPVSAPLLAFAEVADFGERDTEDGAAEFAGGYLPFGFHIDGNLRVA